MIGHLNKRGMLLEREETSNGRGGINYGLQAISSVWFGLYPMSLREISAYRAMNREVNATIIMRYRPDINTDTVLRYKGFLYEFEEVANVTTDDNYLQILAVGVVEHA